MDEGPVDTDPSHPDGAHLCAMAALDKVGPVRLRALLEAGAPAEVWAAVAAGSAPASAVGEQRWLRAEWARAAAGIDPAQLWARCRRFGVGVCALGDAAYPERLRGDPAPPPVLFHRGDLRAASGGQLVAVVGTRRCTGYGRRVAEELGDVLARHGVGVVSGLALGIDAAAHLGTLGPPAAVRGDAHVAGATGPGDDVRARPVAVVAAGPDRPCPSANLPLADRVVAAGLLLSEVPPGVPAAPWRFPVRNRVIAALADVVVVVESAVRGGSLHTVREALDRGRTVMAVPGPVDAATSAGTNELLRDGAAPCLGPRDVLEELGITGAGQAGGATDAGPADRERVLDVLGWGATSLDQVVDRSGLTLDQVATAVARLVDAGRVRHTGGSLERAAGRGGSSP